MMHTVFEMLRAMMCSPRCDDADMEPLHYEGSPPQLVVLRCTKCGTAWPKVNRDYYAKLRAP